MKQVLLLRVKRVLKQTMAFSLLLSFSVYAWARILFYEVPFTIGEDVPIIVKTILLCWGMVLAVITAFNLLVKIGEWMKKLKPAFSFDRKWVVTGSAILFLSAFLYSCNA
jgi:hypothetical protein